MSLRQPRPPLPAAPQPPNPHCTRVAGSHPLRVAWTRLLCAVPGAQVPNRKAPDSIACIRFPSIAPSSSCCPRTAIPGWCPHRHFLTAKDRKRKHLQRAIDPRTRATHRSPQDAVLERVHTPAQSGSSGMPNRCLSRSTVCSHFFALGRAAEFWFPKRPFSLIA